MTDKILIKNTSDADSRTADDDLTKEKLYDATEAHIEEVGRIMDWFGEQLHEIGLKHDFTKVGANFEEYSEVVLARLPEGEFEKTNKLYITYSKLFANQQISFHEYTIIENTIMRLQQAFKEIGEEMKE